MSRLLTRMPVPVAVLTDSYKASHFLMYPESKQMVAYGEFRSPFQKDPDDSRFVFFGMRYIIDTYLSQPWTAEDVEAAANFFSTHNAGYKNFPFPKDLFLKFVHENNGFFPVRIEALPEGTVANTHTPVFQVSRFFKAPIAHSISIQIFASEEYTRLVTFLETILTHVWYPTTVATLSRRTRDLVEEAFAQTVDDNMHAYIESRLHDFGFRG